MTPQHVGRLLQARARLTPDREALLDLATESRYTFAELHGRAWTLAVALAERGVRHGDRVALLSKNHVAYVDLLFACGHLGAILVPLNWRLTAAELRHATADCTPRLLLHAAEFSETAAALGVRATIDIGGPDYAALLHTPPRRWVPPSVGPNDPVCLMYTSGTTGTPKGALIPHRQVVWNAICTAASWGLTCNDVAPVLTPMFHAGGLFVFLTPLVFVGGRSVLGPTFEASSALALLAAERCTCMLAVPSMLQMLLEAPALAHTDLGALRFLISGGAPCSPALVEAWHQHHGVTVRQGYGMTEVGVNCFSMTDEEALRKRGTVGRPILHGELRIVDEHGNTVPPHTPGELLLGGPHVCLGYWKRDDATAEAIRGGWFHTGDLAQIDDEGFVSIVGRLKDMIISGGENVYAAEVEAVVRELEAVADAALIGRPDPKWGEVGWVVVTPERGQVVDEASVLAHCRGKLAKYKVPKRVVVRETLPYSPYGKVDKKALRAGLDAFE